MSPSLPVCGYLGILNGWHQTPIFLTPVYRCQISQWITPFNVKNIGVEKRFKEFGTEFIQNYTEFIVVIEEHD